MSNATTEKAVNMFLARRAGTSGKNTEVVVSKYETALRLHGSTIAKLTPDNVLYIRTCGYNTKTTKERLNGLPSVAIYQKNWDWYLNDKPWVPDSDSDWTFIGRL